MFADQMSSDTFPRSPPGICTWRVWSWRDRFDGNVHWTHMSHCQWSTHPDGYFMLSDRRSLLNYVRWKRVEWCSPLAVPGPVQYSNGKEERQVILFRHWLLWTEYCDKAKLVSTNPYWQSPGSDKKVQVLYNIRYGKWILGSGYREVDTGRSGYIPSLKKKDSVCHTTEFKVMHLKLPMLHQ